MKANMATPPIIPVRRAEIRSRPDDLELGIIEPDGAGTLQHDSDAQPSWRWLGLPA
jgi:hypothetical protein